MKTHLLISRCELKPAKRRDLFKWVDQEKSLRGTGVAASQPLPYERVRAFMASMAKASRPQDARRELVSEKTKEPKKFAGTFFGGLAHPSNKPAQRL